MFPFDKILGKDKFEGMDIVVCGHSLGGAIASIVAIKLFIGLKRLLHERSVKCITFGAPLIGDRKLQECVAEHMSPYIHHFVCNNDPVPNILRYKQSVSQILQDITTHLGMQNLGDTSRKPLLDKKDKFREFFERISTLMPVLKAAVNVVSLVNPDSSNVKTFQNLCNVIDDVTTAIKDNTDVYIPIGNFHFLDERVNEKEFFSCNRLKELEEYMQEEYQQNASKRSMNAHALSYYTELFRKNGNLPFGGYPYQVVIGGPDALNKNQHCNRMIKFEHPFSPSIDSVELIKPIGEESTLNLSFTGKNIYDVVLECCEFDFNFPFAEKKENVRIKKLPPTDENIERLVIQDEMKDSPITISDHGIKIKLATQFGECDEILRHENVRNTVVQSVHQIAANDSVSLVVRSAIQRGMALKKIKMECGLSSSEQIIDEIIQLGTVALGEDEMRKKETEIFQEYAKKFNSVFSNEESYQKIKDFSDKIEEYISSALRIEAERPVIEKIWIGFSIGAGLLLTAFIAGPTLLVIGSNLTAEVMASGLAYAGVAVTEGAKVLLNLLTKEQILESNYKSVLNFIVQELFEAQRKPLSATTETEITDLLYRDEIFYMEKALIKLAPKGRLISFENCSIDESTKESKKEVIKRITAIKCIHRIREILSQQCFIGVVGLQDAGKTTLVKKIWNVGGKSSYFNHTTVPMLYQITKKLLVVDFPGSNSLDNHAKTFSICGAMNNMIIVLIPFSGDVSEIYSQEIAKVFGVMKGSDSTKVILCINKCGSYLKELKKYFISADHMKEDFIDKLNEQYKRNEQAIFLEKSNIFLTDWKLEDKKESAAFGIVGEEEIKDIIKDYLVHYGIYKSNEIDELQRCISFCSI